MWGDDPISSPSILCPPQVSSTPSTAAGGRATTGWCTETSATTARSPSRFGGVATSRSAPSLCKSPHEVPTSPLGGYLGMSWGHTSAGITSNVRLPLPAGGWPRSGVPAASPAASWGCRCGGCSVSSACRMAPPALCTPNTALGSGPRPAGPAAACPARHSGGREPGLR